MASPGRVAQKPAPWLCHIRVRNESIGRGLPESAGVQGSLRVPSQRMERQVRNWRDRCIHCSHCEGAPMKPVGAKEMPQQTYSCSEGPDFRSRSSTPPCGLADFACMMDYSGRLETQARPPR